MRVDDLDYEELLELDPAGGGIRFAGQRALLVDAVAMGLLRKYLVDNFGNVAARTVLTQFGFAHGWRMAEALKTEFTWDSDDDWRRAGMRVHTLEGLFRVGSVNEGMLAKGGMSLDSSYEAEQHLLHFGRSALPVCGTLCGLASGYLSRTEGRRIYVLEDKCLARGDAACHFVGRPREEWGDDRAADLAFYDPNRLEDSLDASLQRITATLKAAERKLREHRRALAGLAREIAEPLGIIARSKAMQQVVDLARRVAKVDTTVLITGESGVGKERIAKLVHEESARSAGPFVAVNCGAITETLLESELFGHARGSFTGAGHDRPGLFEAAHNGTLLLDEIGEVSPGMQVKLLRVLQEREVRRVGENKSRRVDVRVLAATNRDLGALIANGAFRQDLYYRLKVVGLHVPPLRERPDDVLPLARVLLADAAVRMQRKVKGFAPAVADHLVRYHWPGNVRELENAMERAAALARGTRVELEDLPEEVRKPTAGPPPSSGRVRPLDEVEKDYILAALQYNGGNQRRTAEQLQIGSATLYRKLKAYGAGREVGAPPTRTED